MGANLPDLELGYTTVLSRLGGEAAPSSAQRGSLSRGRTTRDVAVVEPADVERSYLEALINGTPGMQCVRAYGSWAEVPARFPDRCPSLLCAALARADEESLGLCRKFCASFPAAAVLVLSGPTPALCMLKFFEAGVRGWIVRPCGSQEILHALVTVASGGVALPDALATHFADHLRACGNSVRELSPREREVLQCLTLGLRPSAIGRRLGVSGHTIRTHLRHIREKMNAGSCAEAVARYLNPPLDDGRPVRLRTP